MSAGSLNLKLVSASKLRNFIEQTYAHNNLFVSNILHKIRLIFFNDCMIIFDRVDCLEDSGQWIIPKFKSFFNITRSIPKIAYIISILNLGKGIFACFTIFQLFINGIIFVYYVFYKVFAFFDVFCIFSELSIHFFIMLSELLCILLLVFLSKNLLARISWNLIFYFVALIGLGLNESFLFIK